MKIFKIIFSSILFFSSPLSASPDYEIFSHTTPKLKVDEYIFPFSTESNLHFTFINNFLGEAKSRILIAVDQFTSQELATNLSKLIDPNLTIKIFTGKNSEKGGPQSEQILKSNAQIICNKILPNGNEFSKMHNKFIVVDEQLMTGSCNLSCGAFQNNIESAVHIKHKGLADLYANYHILIGEKKLACANLKAEIERFNRNDDINVCLSPIYNIKDFINSKVEQLNEDDTLNISMFLISRDKCDIKNDIVSKLISASKRGVKITATFEAHALTKKQPPYMADAILSLKRAAPDIDIRILKIRKGFMHDKLLLLFNTKGEKTVIIGSAGLTLSVLQNKNYENMLMIKSNKLFDAFNTHMSNTLISDKKSFLKKAVFQKGTIHWEDVPEIEI